MTVGTAKKSLGFRLVFSRCMWSEELLRAHADQVAWQGPSFRKVPRQRLQRALPKKESITEAIDDAFVKTHDDLCSSKHDCSISGVTITAAFLRGDELFVANAGDCRAVVGRKKRQEGGGHTVEAIDLTVDHRPDRHDEKNRIEQCGGRCEPVKLQNEEDFVGPVRSQIRKTFRRSTLAASAGMSDRLR